MTPAARFGALDAEARWRDPRAAQLPAVRDAQAERLLPFTDELLIALCSPRDVLLTGAPLVEAHRQYLATVGLAVQALALSAPEEALRAALAGARAAPYAVVPGVEDTCERLGLDGSGLPPLDVVRRVNSKVFSQRLAMELDLPCAGERIGSTAELSARGAALLERGAVAVKDPCGVAGKGTLPVASPAELERLVAFLARQEQAGRRVELILQPLLDRVEDFSCHFDVEEEGGIRWVGVQQMRNEGFAFSAVSTAPPELHQRLEREGYFGVMECVAATLRREGYRGPVCVDSMRLRDGTLVPLLEINARCSMGRMGLSLQARLGGGAAFVHLGAVAVTVRRAVTFEAVLEALASRNALFEGKAGVLPLGARTLLAGNPEPGGPPGKGRLYLATIAEDAARIPALLQHAADALTSCGADVLRVPRA
jgi:hypothetical protein